MPRMHGPFSRMHGSLVSNAFWQGTSDTFDHAELVTTGPGNRWNEPGQPTIYLAGDRGVALVEAGRHLGPDDELERRVIWQMRVRLDSVIDLRAERALEMLDLGEPTWMLDQSRCRAIAARLRELGACEAIRVPSVGLTDIPERWNLVLFVDRLTRPLAEVLSEPRVAAIIGPNGPARGAPGAAGRLPPHRASEGHPGGFRETAAT
jgi:RES domain-containing protein